MSFANQLARLREATANRQEGVRQDKAYVDKNDLRELIYHFDRIDTEIRTLLPKNGSETIILIAQERKRQIEQEGWTPLHDQQHLKGELALAAACYAIPDKWRVRAHYLSEIWPWSIKWWKPIPNNRIRELVKSGALIAAEIDRLRAEKDGEQ